MKKCSWIMLIVGICLSVAGLVCLVVSFSDRFAELFQRVKMKDNAYPSEYDDYADVDLG